VFEWAPEIVEQYVQEIRPAFGSSKHPGLFLTERGTRISVQYVSERFAEIRTEADLDNMLTPHCLRQTHRCRGGGRQ
jgi:site-specific recombinase XerD